MKIKPAKYDVAGSVPGYTPHFEKAEQGEIVAKSGIFKKPHKVKKSSVQSVEVIDNTEPLKIEPLNLTVPRGGIFVSEFERQELQRLNAQLALKEQYYFASENFSPAGRPEAEKARLVKDCKSPTRTKRAIEEANKERKLAAYAVMLQKRGEAYIKATLKDFVADTALYSPHRGVLSDFKIDRETGEISENRSDRKTAVANLTFRKWSEEYRIRVTTDASPSKAPPPQSGDRVTKFLTTRAAKNILDSGAYVSAVRGGYTTFLTLTFKDEARARIVSGESTIGKECSRFFDAIQKMYQRGWTAEKTIIDCKNKNDELFSNNGFECVANDEEVIQESKLIKTENGDLKNESLDYLWVAEAPTKLKVLSSKNGFDCVESVINPHCHVLMRWNVEPHLFRAWAARIESIWGQGFAKLERIKNADAASGYMLKALGYLLKGENQECSDQGEIKGNRYNISKPARALPWEHIASFHAEHMASIIGEVKAKLERKAAPTVRAIRDGREAIKNAIKQKAVFKNMGKQTATIDAKIKAIETKIQQHKAHLRRSPVRAVDYMVTFKGKYPLQKFLNWAVGLRFWNGDSAASERSPCRLPETLLTAAKAGIRKTFSKVRNRLLENEHFWAQRLAAILPPEVDPNEQAKQRITDFYQYQQLLAA